MYELTSPLVTTGWLAARLGATQKETLPVQVRVVDARWRGDGGAGRDLYYQGHIPGAIHLDWQLDLSWTDERGIRDLILPPARFREVMERAGIGDETLVVAYADTDYSGAARLWWALRCYGHERVAVLDGGYNQWQQEGRPISSGHKSIFPTTEVGTYCFTPRPQSWLLASQAEIKAALEQDNLHTRLVDTRPPEQYLGKAVWTPPGSLFLI